jgi:hypothetical protein
MGRPALVLALVALVVPAGCAFGGDMTAEKLEEEVAFEGNELFSIEDVHCREGASWDFECTLIEDRMSYSNSMVVGFNYDGGELTCTSSRRMASKGLPDPDEFCALGVEP